MTVTDFTLGVMAESLNDLERMRIATGNRIRALSDDQFLADAPEVALLDALAQSLVAVENQATKDLEGVMRRHRLGPWVKATTGVGEKQGARLLAALGDPYIRDAVIDLDTGEQLAPARPRSISELWAYCGLHVLHQSAGGQTTTETHPRPAVGSSSSDLGQSTSETHSATAGVAPHRRKGVRANWNGAAKMRSYLVAESALQAGVRRLPGLDDTERYDLKHREPISPLGAVYLSRRAHTRETHPDWTNGHSHNDALRIVAKEVLRYLWIESRRLHAEAN